MRKICSDKRMRPNGYLYAAGVMRYTTNENSTFSSQIKDTDKTMLRLIATTIHENPETQTEKRRRGTQQKKGHH